MILKSSFYTKKWLFAVVYMSALAAFTSDASAYSFKTVHSFCSLRGCKDGSGPGGLLLDQAGNLYGVAAGAGPHHGSGAIYELVGRRKFKVLYGFCADHETCTDGKSPMAPLIIDAAGNLYGATTQGGAHNSNGVAFELSPNGDGSWTYHKLYDFCAEANCSDGQTPRGLTYLGAATGVPYDGTSPLYGAADGGEHAQGVIFQLVPGQMGWSESVLYNFCSQGGNACTDGANGSTPLATSTGNFFGFAGAGGASNAGVVYQLTSNGNSWTETVLYNFCSQADCTDGKGPIGPPVQDALGNLYGPTVEGGQPCKNAALKGFTCGVIFKLSANGDVWQESVLYQFCVKKDCRDGAAPNGELALDASGNLFGTTFSGGGNDEEPGGSGGGVAFELSGSSLNVQHAFCAEGGSSCSDGLNPAEGLIMDSVGDLFGAPIYLTQ